MQRLPLACSNRLNTAIRRKTHTRNRRSRRQIHMALFPIIPCSEIRGAGHQRVVVRVRDCAETGFGVFGTGFGFELVGADGGFDGGAERGFEEAEDPCAFFAVRVGFGAVDVAAFGFVGVGRVVGGCDGDFGGGGAERGVRVMAVEIAGCEVRGGGGGCPFAARRWRDGGVVGFADAEEGYCELCVCLVARVSIVVAVCIEEIL